MCCGINIISTYKYLYHEERGDTVSINRYNSFIVDPILCDYLIYSLFLNIIQELLENRSINTSYQWKLEIIKPLDSIIYLSALPMVNFMHSESRDFIENKRYHITKAADNFIRAFFSTYL